MAGRSGHESPTGERHAGTARACKVAECAAIRRAVERERWKARQGKTEEAPKRAAAAPGSSGAAARAWLKAMNVEPTTSPAAADLLVVADTIDSAKAGGQLQFIAALARQAAALRSELAHAADDDGEGERGGDDDGNDQDGGDDGTWDPAAI